MFFSIFASAPSAPHVDSKYHSQCNNSPKHEIRKLKSVAAQNCAQRSLRSPQAGAPIAAENGLRSAIAAENGKKKCITTLLTVQVPGIGPMFAKSYPSALAVMAERAHVICIMQM